MKKRNLKKLTLTKSVISHLSLNKVKGGNFDSGACESSQVIDHCVLACASVEATNCPSNCKPC